MRTQIKLSLLISISVSLAALPTNAQPRGDLIGATPFASTNASPAIPAQTNTTEIVSLGFDQLSAYIVTLTPELESNTNRSAWADAQINTMIPPTIKAYGGKKIIVEGFMLPTDYDAHGKVSDFIVMKNQMSCCYGGPTMINEFIAVKVNGPGVKSVMDNPVRVKGVLHVGAQRESGRLTAVYRMEAESVSEMPGY